MLVVNPAGVPTNVRIKQTRGCRPLNTVFVLSERIRSTRPGRAVGLLTGVFFVSCPALVEPPNYAVPSVISWALVEKILGIVQFGLFGLVTGLVFRMSEKPSSILSSA